MIECGQQAVALGAQIPSLLGAAALDHSDDVQVFSTAHRVVHEMGARPEPEPDHGRIEGRRHQVARQERAPGGGTGEMQISVWRNAFA
jgi:hypothetical protein